MTTKKPEPFKTPPTVERKFEAVGFDLDPELHALARRALGFDLDPELHALARRILAKDKRKSEDKNDSHTDTMEREARESEGAAAELQALREKIRASVDELIASQAIPEESKAVVLSSIIRDISEACKGNLPLEGTPQKREPPETPPAPDLLAIPRWRGRKRDGMALDFLERHYGQWLAAFGAQEDSVFQDQIRDHDPHLIMGIHNQLRLQRDIRKLRDFIKPRSARTERESESFDLDTLKQAHRVQALLRRRRLKDAGTKQSP